MSIEVEWVGGPFDGRRFAWRGPHDRIIMSAPAQLLSAAADPDDPMAPIEVDVLAVPVRLTRNGYRAYWADARPTNREP